MQVVDFLCKISILRMHTDAVNSPYHSFPNCLKVAGRDLEIYFRMLTIHYTEASFMSH